MTGRDVRFAVDVSPAERDGLGRRRPAAPGAGQPARQRCPAQPARRNRAGQRAAPARTACAWRSPTTDRASHRPTETGCSTASTAAPAAAGGPAAPGSAWPSPGGRWPCTAVRSRWLRRTAPAAGSWSTCPPRRRGQHERRREHAGSPGRALPCPPPTRWPPSWTRVWPDHGRAVPRRSRCWRLLAGLVGAVLLVDNPPGLGVLLTGLAVVPRRAPRRPAPARRARDRLRRRSGCCCWPRWWCATRRGSSRCACSAPPAVASYALAPGRSLVGGLLGWHLAAAGRAALPAVAAARAAAARPRACARSLAQGAADRRADRRTPAGLRRRCSRPPTRPSPLWSRAARFGLLPVRLIVAASWSPASLAQRRVPRSGPTALGRPGPVARPTGAGGRVAGADRGPRRACSSASSRCSSTVLFGGHRHVLETAGLTYAEYARSGFGQLVVVTLLTLSVVAATVRWAPRETRSAPDRPAAAARRALRARLVVVASALLPAAPLRGGVRLHPAAPVHERVRDLARRAGRAGAGWPGSGCARPGWRGRSSPPRPPALLVLGAVNPDGFVAERNIDRYRSDREARRRLPPAAFRRRRARGRPAARAAAVLRAVRDAGRQPRSDPMGRVEPGPAAGRRSCSGTIRCVVPVVCPGT